MTADELRAFLDYDQVTGLFRRRKSGRSIGWVAANGYVYVNIGGTCYLGHRLAWLYVYGEWPPGRLDHKDTVSSHNWIDNLRPATASQNGANANKRSDNTSGVKGVWWDGANKKWRAGIQVSGKTIALGRHDRFDDAAAAYADAAKQFYGEFARTT